MFRPKQTSKRTKSPKGPTSLDLKQQSLREKEEQLRRQEAELKRLIEEAPRIREEQTRRRREQLAADPRLSRTTLVDKRAYHASVATADPTFGHRPLRSEQRDGRWLFVCLCFVLMVIVFWFCNQFMGHL